MAPGSDLGGAPRAPSRLLGDGGKKRENAAGSHESPFGAGAARPAETSPPPVCAPAKTAAAKALRPEKRRLPLL